MLLAFSVFMLAVAENLPETSEFVPLISKVILQNIQILIQQLNMHWDLRPIAKSIPQFSIALLLVGTFASLQTSIIIVIPKAE